MRIQVDQLLGMRLSWVLTEMLFTVTGVEATIRVKEGRIFYLQPCCMPLKSNVQS